MDSKIFYRPKFNNLIIDTLYLCLIIFILIFLDNIDFEKTFSFIFFIIIIVIFYVIFKNKVSMIVLDKEEETITIHLLKLWVKIKIEIKLDEVSFTFKKEVGSRGIKYEIFKIYKNKILLINITPALSGWNEKTLNSILNDIKKCKNNVNIEC